MVGSSHTAAYETRLMPVGIQQLRAAHRIQSFGLFYWRLIPSVGKTTFYVPDVVAAVFAGQEAAGKRTPY